MIRDTLTTTNGSPLRRWIAWLKAPGEMPHYFFVLVGIWIVSDVLLIILRAVAS